jgi:protein-tyrosine phosphatase
MSVRIRHLPGSHNVRDLGGLRGADGRPIRSGVVFRSDYPGFAQTGDGALVAQLRLRTVVDLRRGEEAHFETVAWHEYAVAYHRSPLVARARDSWTARYQAYLLDRPETVVEAVRLVLDPAAHPVLFHCAAGKDRTGVVAALVLSVLGVDEDEIVADYVLSSGAVPAIIERLRRSRGPYAEVLDTLTPEDQVPRPESMHGFLEWLAERGGAERWLLDHGLATDAITAGREALLGAPSPDITSSGDGPSFHRRPPALGP